MNCPEVGIANLAPNLAFPVTGTFWQATQPISFPYATRSDTFTAAGNGTTVNVATTPLSQFAVQLTGTGAAATLWTAVLEGSLDGVTFSTILTHNTAIGNGVVLWLSASVAPCLYFRSRLVSVTLGSATNVVATILGIP